MGTRNLTMVVKKTKIKVAQYGQWDGYPSGQGKTILSFLRSKKNIEDLKKYVDNLSFLSGEELDKIYDSDWTKDHPQLSRDTGAEILNMILESGGNLKLSNQEEFARESLHNEWSYLLDLDQDQLEVYKGFQTKPVPEIERFAKYNEKAEKESMEFSDYDKDGKPKPKKYKYYPIKLIKIYKFNNLPSLDQFIKECDPEEE